MALILFILIAFLICCSIAIKMAVGFVALAAKACVVIVLGLGVATIAKKAFFSK